MIKKIEADTILVEATFEGHKNFKLIKMELKNNYYVIDYYADPENKRYVYYTEAAPTKLMGLWKVKFPTFSVITVPFKIRPKLGSLPSYSKADIDNVGLYVAPYLKWDRLFYDGSTSTHKIGIGALIAPMVEELTVENTHRLPVAKSNQFYLTTAVAITYTYNKISFALIPIACDNGLSDTSKKWIYNGRIWYGFGLGIDTDLFGF